ncbi:MAG: hypothetical protein H0W69_07400 [Gemmatimonadaceae bacterium]|nr:hypothetical protein [Gemmatimonadaceae bacterium]
MLTLGVVYFGYTTAHRFVRDRLRFVEGARKPHIPFVVAFAILAVTIPIAWILPFVGVGSAVALGVGVGAGVAAGGRDLRREDAGAMIVRG